LSWRKPTTFGISFGLTTVTLGWVGAYLPVRPRIGWIAAGLLCAATTYEVAWVVIQHARGVPAHFNDTTVLEERLFIGGAVMVVVAIGVIAAMTLAAVVRTTAPAPMALAIRSGLVGLLAAQATGVWMLGHGLALLISSADTVSISRSPVVRLCAGLHLLPAVVARLQVVMANTELHHIHELDTPSEASAVRVPSGQLLSPDGTRLSPDCAHAMTRNVPRSVTLPSPCPGLTPPRERWVRRSSRCGRCRGAGSPASIAASGAGTGGGSAAHATIRLLGRSRRSTLRAGRAAAERRTPSSAPAERRCGGVERVSTTENPQGRSHGAGRP
jgi:hypothetical protein